MLLTGDNVLYLDNVIDVLAKSQLRFPMTTIEFDPCNASTRKRFNLI